MTFTNLSFKHALQARRYVDRALIPVKFFQEGIYNSSFEDGLQADMITDASILAEEFTARLVNGCIDRQSGWDVVRPNGSTIEVKFRSLGFSSPGKSGNTITLRPTPDLLNKEADELFLYTYNPTTKEVDLFIFPKEVYKERGAYVYYSTTENAYTEAGGKKFLVDRDTTAPGVVYVNYAIQQMQTFGVRFSDIPMESQEAKEMLAQLQSCKISFL